VPNGRVTVGFDVLSALIMKRSVFWDITPCGLTFLQNISPPSSGLKNELSKKTFHLLSSRFNAGLIL
jgi:hypothetical protein